MDGLCDLRSLCLEAQVAPAGTLCDAERMPDTLVDREPGNLAVVGADVSEQLLRLLASVLDIREVFPQISVVANRVLPHDRMTMSLHDGDQTCITHAASNADGPMLVRVTGPDLRRMTEGFSRIIDD